VSSWFSTFEVRHRSHTPTRNRFSGSNAFANRAREQLADAQREANLSFSDEEQLKEGLKSLGVVPPAAERAELAAELLRSEADAC